MTATDTPNAAIAEAGASENRRKQALPGLAWAFAFDSDGKPRELAAEEAPDDPGDGWLWLHFDLADARAVQSVRSISALPEEARDLLLSADEHQQINAEGRCVYGVFAGLVEGMGEPIKDIGYFHFAMTERLLVSSRRNAMRAVDAARHALIKTPKAVTVGKLLEEVVEHVVDAVDDYTEGLADDLDRIEDKVLADSMEDEFQLLGDIRRMAMRLHRQVTISQLLIRRFERDILPLAGPSLQVATKKIEQHIEWLDSEIVALRDRAQLLQEEVMLKRAEQTNRQLQILAIVATVFLPASLIAGIFGMNVKGLPLTETSWGFVWTIVLLLATSGVVLWLLRRSGILGR